MQCTWCIEELLVYVMWQKLYNVTMSNTRNTFILEEHCTNKHCKGSSSDQGTALKAHDEHDW